MSKPLSLYTIDDDLLQLEEALIESGGEITPEMEEQFDDLLQMRADKVAGYVAMIRQFEASASAVKDERQRLQGYERSLGNAAKALKDRLCHSMAQRGETEHVTPIGKVKRQRSGSRPVVLLVDAEALPEHFQRRSVAADLAALKHALGEDDPAAVRVAEFGEASEYVRIY